MPLAVKDANGASQTINTLPAVGQAATAASLPVVVASDQSAIPVSAASLPLPAGAATAAGITSLSGAITSALAPSGGLPVALQGTAAVTQSGTWTVALAANATVALAGGNTVAIKVDGSAVTQPVSGTVTVGSLPALPAGSNAIGTVAVSNLPTIGQKTSSGSVSTDQASNGVIATAYGTLADTATPDITANGASFTFTSLFKGMVANLLAISGKLPGSLGAKLASASLSMAPATDAVFPAPADQDPIFDHANGKKVSVQANTLVLTPVTGCKYIRISCDADVVVNTAGAPAVDDGTSIRLVANSPEVIPVVAGTAVNALSLSGAAAVVRATPMKVRT